MSKTVPTNRNAYIITGPTSGIGRLTALELAKHGTVVLVGRDRGKLDEVLKTIEQRGQHAVSVVCDLSDFASVRRAAAESVALNLPIVGLLNNAGIFPMRAQTILFNKYKELKQLSTSEAAPQTGEVQG